MIREMTRQEFINKFLKDQKTRNEIRKQKEREYSDYIADAIKRMPGKRII